MGGPVALPQMKIYRAAHHLQSFSWRTVRVSYMHSCPVPPSHKLILSSVLFVPPHIHHPLMSSFDPSIKWRYCLWTLKQPFDDSFQVLERTKSLQTVQAFSNEILEGVEFWFLSMKINCWWCCSQGKPGKIPQIESLKQIPPLSLSVDPLFYSDSCRWFPPTRRSNGFDEAW